MNNPYKKNVIKNIFGQEILLALYNPMFEILSSSAQAPACFIFIWFNHLPAPHPPGIFFSESVFLKLRLQPKRDWVFYLMKTTTNWSDLTNHPPLQPPAPPIRLGKFLFLKDRLQSKKGGVLPAQAKLTVFSNSPPTITPYPTNPHPQLGKLFSELQLTW